jgi:peptidyl-prolyl cis-trans isomerase-like protein 2
MGKNRHSKDRLFITATEWATEYGGKKTAKIGGNRPLPFDHCALSLAPYTNPVILGDNGVIFDLESIVPFLKKYHCDPVTGNPMSSKDVIKLNIAKNGDGLWHW